MSEPRSTQDDPIEAGAADATDDAKLDGIIEQVRGDIAVGNVADTAEVLRQRLEDAGLHIDDVDFAELLERL